MTHHCKALPPDADPQLAAAITELQAKVKALEVVSTVRSDPALTGGDVAIAGGVAIDQSVHNTQVNIAPVPVTTPITINIFGQEDTAHLTPKTMGELLDALPTGVPDGQRVVVSVIREIYGNPAHPENLTCFSPNKKDDTIYVRSATGWEPRTGNEIYPKMLSRACTELNDKQDFHVETPVLEERSKQVKAAFEYETTITADSLPPRAAAKALAGLAKSLRPLASTNKGYLVAHQGESPVKPVGSRTAVQPLQHVPKYGD
jgi:hypothetical protein